uniref:CCHC-type domain-containing protein n=1 Tax=Rhizophagus irregularis (strain DAOM 181602 / DAOM 197198 / MUCL 43194) TaxID=747089 RepID=U9UX57_RHIID
MVEMWATELDQRQQQPNESVDEYASSIQELYQRVNDAAFAYPDNLQARKFVSGLQPELYMAVKPFGDQTLADAIGRAKGCELTLRSGKTKLLNYASQTTSEITKLTKLVAALTEQITEIGKKVTGNRPPPRSDSRNPNVPSGPNRTIVCYTCGEAGHVSHRCPINSMNVNNTNAAVAPVVTAPPTSTSTTNDTQSLVQELLKQLNSATIFKLNGASAGGVDAKPDKSSISLNTLFEAYPAQRRSQMRRVKPYSRPVVSEEEESSQPLDIPTAPIDIPKTVEPMIVTETAETSSKAIERTTVNIAAKKKKVPVVKKKKNIRKSREKCSLHIHLCKSCTLQYSFFLMYK